MIRSQKRKNELLRIEYSKAIEIMFGHTLLSGEQLTRMAEVIYNGSYRGAPIIEFILDGTNHDDLLKELEDLQKEKEELTKEILTMSEEGRKDMLEFLDVLINKLEEMEVILNDSNARND